MAENDWSWHKPADRSSVIVAAVQAVAVYTNPRGDIVIRQQDSLGEEDSIIVIPRAAANTLAGAIRNEAKKPFTPDE